MSEEPKALVDFEFHFTSGHAAYVTVTKWGWKDGEPAIFQGQHEDGTTEELTINRSALAYIRCVKREVPKVRTIDSAGRVIVES